MSGVSVEGEEGEKETVGDKENKETCEQGRGKSGMKQGTSTQAEC